MFVLMEKVLISYGTVWKTVKDPATVNSVWSLNCDCQMSDDFVVWQELWGIHFMPKMKMKMPEAF